VFISVDRILFVMSLKKIQPISYARGFPAGTPESEPVSNERFPAKQKQDGIRTTEKSNMHIYKQKNGLEIDTPKSREDAIQTLKPKRMEVAHGFLGIWTTTNDKLVELGIFDFKETTVSACTVVAAKEVHVETKPSHIFGPSTSATASIGKAGASCGASGTGGYVYAGAKAVGAEASAKAALVDGYFEVTASAEAASVQASTNASLLGLHAGADVKVAGVNAGLTHTSLQSSVSVLGAGAELSVGWEYTGATAGAHLIEARAGPFGIRAGVKVGAGIRNGVPEVDMGPVTCCLM